MWHLALFAVTLLRQMAMARNIYIDDNTAYILRWGLYSRSAGIRSARSMQKITGSRPVCTFFNAYKTDCTRMYSYVLVYTSLYIHHIFIIQFMRVQTSMYWYILVCTSTYQYILLMPCHCSVCTGTYSYVPVQTDTFFILPVGNRRRHDMVQGSTCSNTPYHGKAWYGTYSLKRLCTDLSRYTGF